jgi:hypothetical protein
MQTDGAKTWPRSFQRFHYSVSPVWLANFTDDLNKSSSFLYSINNGYHQAISYRYKVAQPYSRLYGGRLEILDKT